MPHSPKKSQIKLRDYTHFQKIILDNFPELGDKIFLAGHVTMTDVDYLESISTFGGVKRISGEVRTLEPLLNYMIDNKHMIEWWLL